MAWLSVLMMIIQLVSALPEIIEKIKKLIDLIRKSKDPVVHTAELFDIVRRWRAHGNTMKFESELVTMAKSLES